MDLGALKRRMADEVDRRAGVLVDVSRRIHANPELRFEERFAHDLLTSILEGEGLEVERGAFGLETAFRARAGTTGPTVAVLCEYDALPGIGHACGHNVIAAAGLGAGLAAAALAPEARGRVVVLGTPGEEGGNGKALMGDRGAFEGLDAAMMVHPAGADLLWMDALALAAYEVDYHGRSAHAAACPEKGLNALDAAVLGYVNVAALRQHMLPTDRVHGVFTRAGDRPNVVPEHTTALYAVRAATSERLGVLERRLLGCLEAGAAAAGCRMEARLQGRAFEVVTNEALVALLAANMAELGRTLADPRRSSPVVGSTDMGWVSRVVPSIHPMIQVSPPAVGIHEPEFADHAGSADADRAVLDGAKAMAMTVADLWVDAAARAAVRATFRLQEVG
jgi:amidohydrolase